MKEKIILSEVCVNADGKLSLWGHVLTGFDLEPIMRTIRWTTY